MRAQAVPQREPEDIDGLDDDGDRDEDDEDDDGVADEDDTAMATVERLSNLDAWELYRFVGHGTHAVLCTVAVRADAASRSVEYAVWYPPDAELEEEEDQLESDDEADAPHTTGTLKVETRRGWDDSARIDVLSAIYERHEIDAEIELEALRFELGSPVAEDDEP